MRILVLPDVHQKIKRVEEALKTNEFDLLISLGDWFDDFYDTPAMAADTARYILGLYEQLGDKFVWLLGNHDLPYVFNEMCEEFWCSGVSQEKLDVVSDILNGNLDRDQLGLCYIIEGEKNQDHVILSHAGISDYHFGDAGTDKGVISVEGVREKCRSALADLKNGVKHNLLRAGKCRSHIQDTEALDCGGIVWQDWYNEFKSVKGYSQIVGHTTIRRVWYGVDLEPVVVDKDGYALDAQMMDNNEEVFVIRKGASFDCNIDTNLDHYMILEKEKTKTKITLKEIKNKF